MNKLNDIEIAEAFNLIRVGGDAQGIHEHAICSTIAQLRAELKSAKYIISNLANKGVPAATDFMSRYPEVIK